MAFLRSLALGILVPTVVGTSPPEPVVLRQHLTHSAAGAAGASVNADGRFVAFVSTVSLLPADGNVTDDIYVFDRETQVITLETAAADGSFSNGSSVHPQLSADGRYLAFQSTATNLTTEADRSEIQDVFVRDRLQGTTRPISIGRGREKANGISAAPSISADGRFVAFASSATNLVMGEDANGTNQDVYLVCLETGETNRISVDTARVPYGSGFAPRLSGDGRFVSFTGEERSVHPSTKTAGSRLHAVYVRDISAAVTTCVSCDRQVPARTPPAFASDISADGRIVAFTVLTGLRSKRTDIAVHDRLTSTTTVITRQANARSGWPRLSADGRMVVFESEASDLLCSRRCSDEEVDDNLLPDIYLFDRDAGRFTRVSGTRRGWWWPSQAPNIDRHGQIVVFSSRQPFGPEDVTVDFDLYVCDRSCK